MKSQIRVIIIVNNYADYDNRYNLSTKFDTLV